MTDEQKQPIIVRQSQLKLVMDYLQFIKTPMPLKDVVGFTNVLTDYCLKGWSTDLEKRLEKIDNKIAKQYEEE